MKHLLRLAAGAAVIVLFMAGMAHASNSHGASVSQPQACGEAGTITLDGKPKLWPPNHKMSSYTVSYSGGLEADTLSTNASHDEIDPVTGLELKGTGKKTNVDIEPADASAVADATGVASTSHRVRAERSGHGDGRTYTITFTVADAAAAEVCTGSFTIDVPKSRKGGSKAA